MQIAAAYIRVSTEEQLEYSPDSQMHKIQEYADTHNIQLPGEFIFLDEGLSGRNAKKRPAFMKMISLAKQKPRPFDVILVWKFSRFARNRQDSILYKSMLRKDCGIDVISITEQLSNDPTAILIEALLEAMDEYYSINLAQEVRRGMQEKFNQGGVVSIPPFGYRMGEEYFEIEPEKAAIVSWMYDDFLRGKSCRQIAQQVNAMGMRTNRGNPFETRTVEYILSNPVYTGKLRRNNDKKEQIANGHHEPIIKSDIYREVQKQLKQRKRMNTCNICENKNHYMLQGLVRCSACGSTLTRTANGKSLQCYKYARGQCAISHSISIDKINRAVQEQLIQDVWDGEIVIDLPAQKCKYSRLQYQDLLKKEEKKLERIREAYENGIDDLEEYKTKKRKIKEQIQTLQEQLEQQEKVPKMRKLQVSVKEILELLETDVISETCKNILLRSFLEKIVFYRKENAIQISYYHSYLHTGS